ncbi:hypothetical protein OY671_008458, partial [Metschnikowia pulcherrima]
VARAEPNGYTSAINTMSSAINPALFRTMPFDTVRDSRSVGTVGTSQHVSTVAPSSPVNNVKESLDYIRARPANESSFGSAGTGSTFHMAAESFKSVSGTQMSHVPYKGGGPAMTDSMAGRVDMSFASVSETIPYVNSGKSRASAVTSNARSAALPDVPTVAESGYPGFEASAWTGSVGPAGMSPDMVNQLNARMQAVLKEPAVIKRSEDEGSQPSGGTPADFEAYMKSETAKWADVVKAANIKSD